MCTAILFNMNRLWVDQDGDGDEDLDSESEDGVDNSDMEGDNEEEEEEEYEIQEGNPSTIRVRGQAERDILINNML